MGPGPKPFRLRASSKKDRNLSNRTKALSCTPSPPQALNDLHSCIGLVILGRVIDSIAIREKGQIKEQHLRNASHIDRMTHTLEQSFLKAELVRFEWFRLTFL